MEKHEVAEEHKALARINNALQELVAEVNKMMAEKRMRIAEDPEPVRAYLDSTGLPIVQDRDLVLVDRTTGTIYHPRFKNGNFFDPDLKERSFEFTYDYTIKHYWVVQTGSRIACYRTNCLFNKHNGCVMTEGKEAIIPILTIGGNYKAICGSEISIDNTKSTIDENIY